jgi:hypothetical protein
VELGPGWRLVGVGAVSLLELPRRSSLAVLSDAISRRPLRLHFAPPLRAYGGG